MVFEGVVGNGFLGDIAVDDITYQPGVCTFTPPGAVPPSLRTTTPASTSPAVTTSTAIPTSRESSGCLHRDADFPLFSVIFGLIFSSISSFSFWTFCLFLCSFSVRRHAHVDFQLFSQKSSGIPVYSTPNPSKCSWALIKYLWNTVVI